MHGADAAGQQRAKHRFPAHQRSRPDRLLDLAFPIDTLRRSPSWPPFPFPEPVELQLPEPRLPPWRIGPATSDSGCARPGDFVNRPSAPAAPATGFNFEGIAGANSFPPDTERLGR